MDLSRANALIDAAGKYIFSAENRISQLQQQLAEKDQIIVSLQNQLETALLLSELIENPEQLQLFQGKLDQLSAVLLNRNESS